MKYFKPGSLTWWGAMAPLASGVFIAFAPVHGLTDYAASITNLFGGATPTILINAGLVGIGVRGALR